MFVVTTVKQNVKHSVFDMFGMVLVYACIFFILSFFFTPHVAHASILTKPANNLGLVGYWNFNEGTSTYAGDFSANSNVGVLTGMANPPTATSGWGNGKFGGGLSFDGVNDYVNVGNVGNVQTISYWVKSNNQANGGIELNANQYIDDNAIPEGMINPTLYVDGVVKTLYGSELVVNGDMEAASTWTAAGTPTSQARSSEQAHSGTYSWKIVTTGGFSGARQTVTTLYGSQYKASVWFYKTSGVYTYLDIGTDSASYIYLPSTSSDGSWNYARNYGTSDITASPVQIRSFNGATTAYFDDVSLKKVLIRYPITDTNWHFVVITTDTAVSASAVKIGKGEATYLNGSIDDVRIYNRALSPSEVTALYKSGGARFNTSSVGLTQGTTLANGIVGHWTFDGKDTTNTTATDLSGQGNTGTFTGFTRATNATAGKLGQGMSFDGVNDYVTNALFSWANNSPITVSFWNYSPGGTAASAFTIGNSDSPNRIHAHAPWIDNVLYWDYGDATNGRISTSYSSYLNKWTLVTLVNNGTNFKAIYLNGVLVTSGTTVATPPTAQTGIWIGAWPNFFHNGKIDDFRIYNRTLSANEVKQLYNLGSAKAQASSVTLGQGTTLANGIVGHWTFDGNKTTNTTALDSSGQNNTGTFTNFTRATNAKAGKLGQGLSFDGVDDYVGVPLVSSKTNDFSFAFWLKVNVASDTRGVIFYNGSGSDGYGFVAGSSDGGDTTKFMFLAELVYWENTNVGWTQNAWHHIVGTLNSSNVWRLYKDGALVFTSGVKPILNIPTVRTTLGKELVSGGTVNHSLDEVRVYNRVLSATEVKQLYLIGK